MALVAGLGLDIHFATDLISWSERTLLLSLMWSARHHSLINAILSILICIRKHSEGVAAGLAGHLLSFALVGLTHGHQNALPILVVAGVTFLRSVSRQEWMLLVCDLAGSNAQLVDELAQVLMFGSLEGLLGATGSLFGGVLLPGELLEQLLLPTLLSVPLQLFEKVTLTLNVRTISEIALSQIISDTFAHLQVMKHTCTFSLFIGVVGVVALGMAKCNVGLVSDQVAIAGVLRMRSRLLGARELLIIDECRLWLNLELGALVICTIQLLNIVDVVNLGLVELVV